MERNGEVWDVSHEDMLCNMISPALHPTGFGGLTLQEGI